LGTSEPPRRNGRSRDPGLPTDGAPLSGDHDHRALARSSGGIAVLAGLGVLAGFLVDATMAALFGANARTDAFFVAATIPFALASLVLASVNQVIVPVVHRWFDEVGPDEARRRVGGLLGTAVTASLLVGVVGTLLAPVLPLVLAPGASAETQRAASLMTALLFTTVVTRVGAEILRSALNARFSFQGPAAMPIVENGVVLASILLLHDRLGVTAVAVGYVAGGFVQLAFVGALALRHHLVTTPSVRFGDPEIRAALRRFALPLSGNGLTMLSRAVERFLASFLPVGQITILNYAWRLVNSIGGTVFFRSVVVALLPRLSASRDDRVATGRTVSAGMRLMTLISLPLLAFVVVLAAPLVAVAFERGAFSPADAAVFAAVIAVYALQFPFDALTRVCMSYWYARFNTRVPFWNVAIGVGLDVIFAAALFAPFGLQGIAFGYVISSVGYFVHGMWSVRRRVRLPLRPLAVSAAKVFLASVSAAAAMWGVLRLLPAARGTVAELGRLAVPGAAGVIVLLVALSLLRFRLWEVLRPDRGVVGALEAEEAEDA
jgi:murein biosynthesis integral membrane protein MurJ